MELIPAIDLLGGRVVRLHQGDYDAVTAYSDDPVAVAEGFAAAGAKRLHVVDLDGARSGSPGHLDVITEILKRAALKVQVGGGVRTRESAERWLDAGAARVVFGTAAIKTPDLPRSFSAAHPGASVIAIDARDGFVAVEGWIEMSEVTAEALASEVDKWGVGAVLFTNIERDGTRAGPDVAGTAALQKGITCDVIASGGIGSLAHLEALARANVRSAVCGRALYSGAFTYAEAVATLAEVN